MVFHRFTYSILISIEDLRNVSFPVILRILPMDLHNVVLALPHWADSSLRS